MTDEHNDLMAEYYAMQDIVNKLTSEKADLTARNKKLVVAVHKARYFFIGINAIREANEMAAALED